MYIKPNTFDGGCLDGGPHLFRTDQVYSDGSQRRTCERCHRTDLQRPVNAKGETKWAVIEKQI